MVADALKLLPTEKETARRWSTLEWSKERRGWIFLTSTPETRKRLLPLTSLWLDTLVLRLMNQGQVNPQPVWFVLDELASLQRLPQLHTAITENRKSNNPVVLGFQGRSQLETRYGHEAEAMMSQPATKIFLRTSEPRAAKWISETIGEVEIERIREGRSSGQFPQQRNSMNYGLERQVEPLVMASEVSGLAPLHGYLKSGNLVVRMSFPYTVLANHQPAFIQREITQTIPPREESKAAAAGASDGLSRAIHRAAGSEAIARATTETDRAKGATLLRIDQHMLTISKPLSAGQARTYHAEEFGNARENYYTEADQIRGEWHGRLAEQWGLSGEVREEHFQHLAEGQHPTTGEQLIRHQPAREYMNRRGEEVSAMEHRAGWDATFSAPKSVSLTALVGGDERVREAHRESVDAALAELERYVQARMGGNLPAETTGKWIAAKFEHDSARPVDGYAAPQLHTHVVFFNITVTDDGKAHALQPRELYKSQQYATAVYRSELAHRLKELGYEVERGESSQPEIKGYSREYLEASSPRRQQIEEHLARTNQRGAGAAQIAAHQTRENKLELSHGAMQEMHRTLAAAFGNQPDRVVKAAQMRTEQLSEEPGDKLIGQALTYSRDKNLERDAVADERDLLRDALKRSMGSATVAEIRVEFEKRVQSGEFIETSNRGPDRAFTTQEMISYERDTIRTMHAGQKQHAQIAGFEIRRAIEQEHPQLNEGQRAAVEQILSSRDQVMALEGVAGAGKTTSLAVVREAAEREGYKVEGFAPTSRAAQKLAEAGIESSTLQRHLMRSEEPYDGQKRLYVLDESSLASSKQMNEFLHRLKANDRVLLVGDTRQHEAVEAGRPYQQLQEAGIETARLDEIVRQKDPALKEVVEHLSRGNVREAIEQLDAQGRIHEIPGRDERLKEIAREYVTKPEGTLVVSPDNQSRRDINETIHREMQTCGPGWTQRTQAASPCYSAGNHGSGPAVGRTVRTWRCRALREG